MKGLLKNVVVLIPMTIPSTGKSCLLEVVKKMQSRFEIWSISSD